MHLFREEIGGNNSYCLSSINSYNSSYIGHSLKQSLLETRTDNRLLDNLLPFIFTRNKG
jgi:hypothetical protein